VGQEPSGANKTITMTAALPLRVRFQQCWHVRAALLGGKGAAVVGGQRGDKARGRVRAGQQGRAA
jgi:hypothetical protein